MVNQQRKNINSNVKSITVGGVVCDTSESVCNGWAEHFKKIAYNINVMRQTACLVVNPVKVNSFGYLFNCTTVGRTSD